MSRPYGARRVVNRTTLDLGPHRRRRLAAAQGHGWQKTPALCAKTIVVAANQRAGRCASTALRVASSVKVSVSFGIPVTNGLIIHPNPVGISRVSEATSLCT